MKALRLVLLLLLVVPSLSFGQAAKKIPVAVFHNGDDSIGQSIAVALKEAIRASQSFVLVEHDPVSPTPRIVVHLTSFDIPVDTIKDLGSAVSSVFVYDSAAIPIRGAFIAAVILTCGRDRIEDCARIILPDIATAVELLRTGWPALWKSLVSPPPPGLISYYRPGIGATPGETTAGLGNLYNGAASGARSG